MLPRQRCEKTRTFLLPLCLGTFASCAMVPASGETEAAGSNGCLQPVALPRGAVITVPLIAMSRADVPAMLLGEQLIPAEGRQPPFAFSIGSDPGKFQPDWR